MADRCATCRFFDFPPGAMDWIEADCRRHAPTREPVPTSTDLRGQRTPMWPRVKARDWCGDHEHTPTQEAPRP